LERATFGSRMAQNTPCVEDEQGWPAGRTAGKAARRRRRTALRNASDGVETDPPINDRC
jgi:hypothetical protein